MAYYIPPVPPGTDGVNINDVYVDENGLIYAIDRKKDGLYILEMELYRWRAGRDTAGCIAAYVKGLDAHVLFFMNILR